MSAKKKRFGSRRRVANQNETSKADDVTDSTFVAQRHIPEEDIDSLNAFANLDDSQSETQHPPSPELLGNRRKLGSSRRNKGLHVKDSATESYYEPREEVEQKTKAKETTITKQMSLAIRPEGQEVISHGNEHDIMIAKHGGILDLAATPDYYSEVQNSTTNCPEADLESLIPKSENLQEDLDENRIDSKVVYDSYKLLETMQEGIDQSDILHKEEVGQSAHVVGISDMTSLSVVSFPTVDQQLIHRSNFGETSEEKLSNVSSVTETEGKEIDDNTELFRQDGNLKVNASLSESHEESVVMQFSTTPEITTETISPNTEIECSVRQAALSSPKEELPIDEEQTEHVTLSEVVGAHRSDDAVNNMHVQEIKLTEMPEIDYTSEIVKLDATEYSEIISVKSADDSPTNQGMSDPNDKEEEHPTKENNVEKLEQKVEDYHVYDTKEPQISDIEIVDTASGQVYEIESRVEADTELSAEETGHQEKEGLFSETEESELFSQTLQSEIDAAFVSDLETTEMSLTTETAVQGKSMDIMQEELDNVVDAQTEDVCDQVKEDVLVGISNLTSSCSTVDQQTIDHFNVMEMPDEEPPNVSSIIDKDNKEGDEDKDLFRQDGNKEAHDSEDPVNKVHEDDVTPTENQETPQIDYSPESVIHDATEHSGILSGNLMEQTEISDTYQSELTVKMSDDSPTNQEISNPEEKQDEHPIKQHNQEALEQRNEDHVFDTEEPQISNIQRVDSEVGQVYEIEGRVEGDKTPRAEQTGHQEKEGLYSDMETLQSKTDDHYDSQPEQDDTGFNPIGKRRKLASSRRSKGRRHVKGSAESKHEHKEEDVESTRGNEAFESAEMLSPEERASQEGLSQGSEHDLMPVTHDSSLYSAIMSGYSSEVQNAATTNYSEADWETLIPKREYVQEDHDERETNFKVEMSDKSGGATLEGADKYAALQSQEARGDHHSEDALNELHGQEVTQAENQEMPENDHSPETLIDVVTEHSGIISGNLMEQSEINETYHSDLTVKSADDSPTNQEVSNPNDKEEEHPTKENNVEKLEQKVEDYHVYDTKDPQISDIERVDTAPGQLYEIESRVEGETELSAEETGHQEKEGLFSEMEESELFSQTLQSEIDVAFDSDLQATEISLTTETAVQGKSMDTMQEELDNVVDAQTEDVCDQVKEDVLVGISNLTSSCSTVDQQTIDHSNVMEMPDEEPPNVSSVIDKDNKEGDEDKDLFRQDGNKEAHDSEDKVHEDEVKPTENQETPQIDYSPESVIHDATEHSGILSGNLMEQTETSDTYQSELTVKMADDSPTNQEISNPDDKQDEQPTKQNNHESDDHVDEYINPIGKRRKLGSSRRNKGRQHVNDSAAESSIKPTEEVVGNTSDNEDLETREMSLTTETEVQEKSMDTVLVGMDTAQTEDVSDQVKEDVLVGISNLTSSCSTADQQTIDHFNVMEMPDEEPPNVSSVIDKENKEGDEDKDLFRQDGNKDAQDSEDSVNKVHEHDVTPTENQETPQIDYSPESVIHDATEHSGIISGNLMEQTETSDTYQSELTVKMADDSPTNQEISNPEEKQDEHPIKQHNYEALEQRNEDHVYDTEEPQISNIQRVDSEVGQVYEIEGRVEGDKTPRAEQTGHQEKEGLYSDMETLQSKTDDHYDSQPEQDDTSFNPIGKRRKLASSRRSKGRRHVKGSAESNHEHKEEDVESTRGNEAFESAEMLSPEERASQQGLSQGSEHDLMPVTHDSSLYSPIMSGYSSEVQNVTTTNYSEADWETLIPKREFIQEDHDERETNFKVEMSDKSGGATLEGTDKYAALQSQEVRGDHHSEDALNELHGQEVTPAESQEMPENDHSPESVIDDVTEHSGILSGNLMEQTETSDTYQSELTVKMADDSPTNQEISNPDDKQDEQPTKQNNHESDDHVDEYINPIGKRRKLGSSRRNKGRQHVNDSAAESSIKPTEEVVGNTSDNEDLETREMSLTTETEVQEKSMDTVLVGMDTAQTEDVSDQVKENDLVDIDSMYSNLKGDQSDFMVPDDELPGVCSITERESMERDLDKESEDKDSSITREISKENNSPEDLTDIECSVDEPLDTETRKQEEFKKQTDLDFKAAGEMRKTRATLNENMSEEDTHVSQTVMDNNAVVTTDRTSSPGEDSVLKYNKEVNEEENIFINLTHNLSQPTGCDTVKTDSIPSPEVSRRKETNMQQHNDSSDTVGDSVYVQVYQQEEETGKKVYEATHAELFSAANNKTDTLAPFNVGLEENIPAVGVSEGSEISSQQDMEEETNLDDSGNVQARSKQRRRKMGSTRRDQLKRKPEGKRVETKESDIRGLDETEAVEGLTMIETAEMSQNENAKPPLSPVYEGQQEPSETRTVDDEMQELQRSDLQGLQSDMRSDMEDSEAHPPEQSASHNEKDDAALFVHVAEIGASERNAGVEPSQVDDFTTSVFAGINTINPLLSSNTEDITNTDEERPDSENVRHDQVLKSAAEASVVADLTVVKSTVEGGGTAETSEQEPDNVNEGAGTEDLEMKNTSPPIDSTSRRRKMGSTRRNLISQAKQEDLQQKQRADEEAAETVSDVGDVKTESLLGIIEEQLQLHLEPPAHRTFEENPVSHSEQAETEQSAPSDPPALPSTSPKHESESASGGRRRKMGSHRKSHGHQNDEKQTTRGDKITDTQDGGDESTIKTSVELKEESLGRDKTPKVDQSDKKPLSSPSEEGEHSRPVNAKTPKSATPVQHLYAEIRLAQGSPQTLSLGNSIGAEFISTASNVMMVGDSSVGKTSFMKRAHSGKFSLDIPASVGLDSCMWTVVVDGKPVVLQLWDTAGQERFHSITRQIFHKAHAFLLMYDITSSQSFSAVSYWASCIQEGASENVTVVLVGNKNDRADRQVKTQEAELLAKEYNFEFMECSAATGENVVQSLETVARLLSQKADTREEAATVLQKEPQQKKSSGCC